MRASGLIRVEPWASEVSDCASLPVSLNLSGVKITPRAKAPVVTFCLSCPRFGLTQTWMSIAQAVGSMRRGSALTSHCSWALCFFAAADTGSSAAALFIDVKSAYYSVVHQLVVGTGDAEYVLRGILANLNLQPEAQAEVLRFINEQGSLMQGGGASFALIDFMRELT